MRKIFLSAVLLLVLKTLPAQVTQQWVNHYTSSGADYAKKVKTDASGNVYVLGTTNADNTNGNAALVKYNSAGTQVWATFYNSPNNNVDEGKAFVFDAAGNIYVTGNSIVPGSIGLETFVVKFNSAGVQQWVSRYSRTDGLQSYSEAVAVDASGNVFIAGYTTVSINSTSTYDFLTIKYNASGTQQWVKTYNGTYNNMDAVLFAAVDASGNLYVSGFSEGLSGGAVRTYRDFLTIKYDTNGNSLWLARFDYANSHDQPVGMQLDASGNLYLGGQCGIGSISSNDFDFIVMKYNSRGTMQWVKHYGGPGVDVPYGFAADGAGNSYLTGLYAQRNSCATVKYNSDGVLLWSALFANSFGKAVAVDASGNVYVAAFSSGDYRTIKYSATGVSAWTITYNGTGNSNDSPESIAVYSPSGPVATPASVYITGSSYGIGTNYDITTVKYSQQLVNGRPAPVADEKNNELTPGLKLAVIPSLVNTTASIVYELSKECDVTVTLYNMEGKQLQVPVSGRRKKGRYSEALNTSAFPPGMYRCILTTTTGDGVMKKNVSFVIMR